MEDKPNYYSVIPASVRYDDELKPNEKLLYGEITALSNKFGECYATNKYFAKLYGVENETISRWIKHLYELGYIDVEILYKNNTKEIDKRIIKINGNFESKPLKGVLIKKSIGYRQKNQGGIDKKVKENNTSINNININIKENIIKEIIEHLNFRTKSKFKFNSKTTISKINARLNEGYNLDDFIVVIDKKCDEWIETEFEKYLNPDTLFGTKFEKYLNQKEIVRKQNNTFFKTLEGVVNNARR